MFTIRIVQTFIRNEQVFENPIPDDVFLNDPRDVLQGDAAVKNALRIDRHCRAVFALFQASGLVGTYPRRQFPLLEFCFEGVAERFASVWIAATPAVSRRTLVAANENMMRKRRHRDELEI